MADGVRRRPHPRSRAASSPTCPRRVADCHRVFATCPRPATSSSRSAPRAPPPRICATLNARGLRAAVLFGPERAGLDNDDIACADTLVRYPLNPAHMSLNLAQAVMILAYEWWTAAETTPPRELMTNETRVATKGELEGFLDRLVAELDACGLPRQRSRSVPAWCGTSATGSSAAR